MRSVQDLVEVEHFPQNINMFHRITGAAILVVTKNNPELKERCTMDFIIQSLSISWRVIKKAGSQIKPNLQ